MKLLGRDKLSRLRGRGDEIEKWVRGWAAEVIAAHWKHPADIRDQFPNARHHGNGVFAFPIGQSPWTVFLQIAFTHGVALITELKANDEAHGS